MKEMDGQIIMVLITLKMYHTTPMRTRKRNPQFIMPNRIKILIHKKKTNIKSKITQEIQTKLKIY